MGKIKFLLLCIFFILAQKVTAQKYDLSYEVKFRPKIEDTITVKEYYTLLYDPQKQESLFSAVEQDNPLNIMIYKKPADHTFLKYESILNSFYKTKYDLDAAKWTLVSGGKTIMGYPCRKAEIIYGNRKWVAWYTRDISFQEGPYVFSGLPGLVLKVSSADGDYRFLIKGIEKSIAPDISLPTATLFANADQEIKFKKEVIADPASQYRGQIQQLKSRNIGVSVSFDGREITSKDTALRIANDFQQWRNEHTNPIEKEGIWIK